MKSEIFFYTKGLCPFESPSSDFKNGENEGFPLIFGEFVTLPKERI